MPITPISGSNPTNPSYPSSQAASNSAANQAAANASSARIVKASQARRRLVNSTSQIGAQPAKIDPILIGAARKAYSLSPESAKNYIVRELNRSVEVLQAQEQAIQKGIIQLKQNVQTANKNLQLNLPTKQNVLNQQKVEFSAILARDLPTIRENVEKTLTYVFDITRNTQFMLETDALTTYFNRKALAQSASLLADYELDASQTLSNIRNSLGDYSLQEIKDDRETILSSFISEDDLAFLSSVENYKTNAQLDIDRATAIFNSAFEAANNVVNTFLNDHGTLFNLINALQDPDINKQQTAANQLNLLLQKLNKLDITRIDAINALLDAKTSLMLAKEHLVQLEARQTHLLDRQTIKQDILNTINNATDNDEVLTFMGQQTAIMNNKRRNHLIGLGMLNAQISQSLIEGYILTVIGRDIDTTGEFYLKWKSSIGYASDSLSLTTIALQNILRTKKAISQLNQNVANSQSDLNRAQAMLAFHQALVKAKRGF